MKNKLSIYLIKEQVTDVNSIFKNQIELLKEYNPYKQVYFVGSNFHQPMWLKNFFEINDNRLFQANSKVVLLVKRTYGDIKRTFALTFGYAKPLFNEDVIEEQFGLKIVLNTVKADDIRKISKLNIGGNQKQSQEQMPKAAKISDFGFNITSDLMKTVTATCSDQKFENAVITGGDIFSITVDRKIDTIEDFLDHCYHRFTATSYRENFEWIDNIKAVKSKELIEKLDNQVINNIISHSLENICLAVPEVINWEQVKCFKYSGSRDEYDDIDINDFLITIDNMEDLSMNMLKNKIIRAISAENENNDLYSWSAQKCLIAEIEYESRSYCLNNNKWYQIAHSFETKIKDEYLTIPIYETELPNYKSNGRTTYTENEYNEDLAQEINAALIHRVGEIPFGGGRGNKIEVCDILTQNKELIHIKKSGGSSLLSHLFNQAAVSGEALLDAEFRAKYNSRLQEEGFASYIDNDFRSNNYTVVLGIISKGNEQRPQIPFFSKVAIRYATKTLSNLGYNVAIRNIHSEELN